jgi:hypothetical protein
MAIESFVSKTAGTDYDFKITEMVLYLSCYKEGGKKECSFKEIECQSQTINSNNFTSKEYELIDPACMLAVAFQDNTAGNSSELSQGKFKIRNNIEQSLDLFYIKYNNLQLPDPQSVSIKDNETDTMADRYYENLRYAKKNILKDSVEPIETWYEKGIYMLYSYTQSDNRRVIVNAKFKDAFNSQNSISCLLFSWIKKHIKY